MSLPPDQRRRGHLASRAGGDAEAEVGQALGMLGVVWWQLRPGVAGAPGALIRTSKGGPDFVGVLPGGRALAVEVKTRRCVGVRVRESGRPVVAPHQLADLLAAEGAGAVAGVLFRSTGGERPAWWWVRASVWARFEREARGGTVERAYAADCRGVHVEATALDALRAAVRLWSSAAPP